MSYQRLFLALLFTSLMLPLSAQDGKGTKKPPNKFRWVNPPAKKYEGLVDHHTFNSPSMGRKVGYNLYLPPAYALSEERFPVVYYLHGGRPGSESKSLGLIPAIDAAIRESGKPGAIYVFVNGGPVSHYDMPGDTDGQGASVFIRELIPHIDATYRTIADRGGRAVEGFSQGGRGTMRLSLRHPELFGSAAPGGGGYATEKRISETGGVESETLTFAAGDNVYDLARSFAMDFAKGDVPMVNWQFHVGTKGFNYENNLAYMEFLRELKIPHQSVIVDGAKHSAKEIYAQRGAEIVRFHLKSFGQSSVKID